MRQLKYYSWILRRWSWLILLGVAICSSITFGVSKYLIQQTFQATTLIQVNGSLTLSNTSNGGDIFSDQALAVGDSLLITSTDVLQRVAQKIPAMSLNQLKSSVSASPQASSQIIEVRVQAHDPQIAANVANTVVNIFIQSQTEKAMAPLQSQDSQTSQDMLTTKAAIDQLQKQLTVLQKSGASPDAIQHENSVLTTYQTNYNSLQANEQTIQLKENQVENALIVAQTAIPPDQPDSPKILLNTIIAAALGLLLMIILVLLLDWFDVSIQTSEDVARLAQLEALGSVPFSKNPLLLDNMTDSSKTGDERIEQTFTAMVMSTTFSTLNKAPYSIMVTGLRMGTGITTTTTNLAISLARSGKRVLLVDANQRRPSHHNIFHNTDTKETFNSLTDLRQFYEGWIKSPLNFWPTDIPNLWFLPISSTEDSTPLLQQVQDLRTLTNWLLGRTQNTQGMKLSGAIDVIIFDTSALSEGIDPIVLASVADCSILVAEAGKEQSEMVSKAAATLQQLGSTVLGVVVNRQTARHRSYFYADNQHHASTSSGSQSLEETIEALATRQALSPGVPVSQLQIKQLDGLK